MLREALRLAVSGSRAFGRLGGLGWPCAAAAAAGTVPRRRRSPTRACRRQRGRSRRRTDRGCRARSGVAPFAASETNQPWFWGRPAAAASSSASASVSSSWSASSSASVSGAAGSVGADRHGLAGGLGRGRADRPPRRGRAGGASTEVGSGGEDHTSGEGERGEGDQQAAQVASEPMHDGEDLRFAGRGHPARGYRPRAHQP